MYTSSSQGDLTANINNSNVLTYQNSKQLDLFDKIDTTRLNAGLFTWDINGASDSITCINLEKGSVQMKSFYEFSNIVHKCDTDKINALLFDNPPARHKIIDTQLRLKAFGVYRNFSIKGAVHENVEGHINASGIAIDMQNVTTQIKRLDYLEQHDDLTELKNVQMLDTFIKSAENWEPATHALVIANIDGLKEINDSLGYYAGNQLIKNVAEVIRECFDTAEIITRIGGGEYCAIFFDKDNLEIEMKIKQASYMLHRMYLNLIKTEVNFAYAIECGSMDFTQLYRDVSHKMSRSINMKKLLNSKNYVDIINDIIAQKTGWGKRCTRVQSLASQIGTLLGCREHVIEEIKVLAKLADIGLMSLDDRLLKNRLHLGGKDCLAYQNHVEFGRRLITCHDMLCEFEDAYLDVYKRYDEWKDGLSISSRIVAAVLRFDDITAGQERTKYEKIKTAMQKERGSKYCPEVIDALIRIAEKYNVV